MTLITAMIYLQDFAVKQKKPLVIIMPLESNGGAHDGSSVLCGTIDDFTSQLGTRIVTGTGNEGDKDTRTMGMIPKANDTDTVELKVAQGQDAIAFYIWVKKPSIMSISVTSPTGESIDKIPIKVTEEQGIKFVFEKTLMSVQYYLSDEQNGAQAILVRAIGLKPGIWQFKLYGEYIVQGEYSSWLPQSVLLSEGTKFLRSNQNTTISDAATARKVVSVAYYDQNNDSIVGSSGRGFTWDGRIKSGIAAGGINAKVVKPGDTIGTASGSSVATSIVAGVCAMILQWGIVEGNDPNIYEENIISYIIRGARTRTGDEYPNEEWGYGMIDVDNIFEIIRGNYRSLHGYCEYYVNNLFIRTPVF